MIWREDDKIYISGHGTATVAARTIWPGNSIIPNSENLIIYTVSSTSANDTLLGTGAQIVEVIYLNGLLERKELTLELNGQTGVEIEALHIEQLSLMSVGTGGTNAGVIHIGTGTVTSGVPAVKYDQIPVGEGVSHAVRYTVPTAMKFTIEEIKVSTDSAVSDVTLQLCKNMGDVTYVIAHMLEGKISYVYKSGDTMTLRHLNASVSGEVYVVVTGKLEMI
tara:strand:- start:963 stop:1625 length:663 start_codon:yes stop_codon:yes gene_type:complete